MLLIAFTLSLLVIVAGMKLLAQTTKDNLGNLYKYVSWFVVAMGFLAMLCVFAHCCMRHCERGERDMMMMHNRCMMDRDGGWYGGMRGGCDDDRNCERGMMHSGCNMNDGNCCRMHEGCSEMGGGSCKEKSSCNEEKDEDGDMKNCPMMKDGHCAKGDSACTNMKK